MSEEKGRPERVTDQCGSRDDASLVAAAPLTKDIDLDVLSKRAKALAMAWFGMMVPGKGDVTLHLRENRPTAETKAALAELVAAGVISEEPFNKYGGLVYRPLVNCRPAFVWFQANADDPEVNFKIMEPVPTSATQAKALGGDA